MGGTCREPSYAGRVDGGGIALIALVMAVGLAGTIVPMLPGLLLIWGAALAYGLLGSFGAAGVVAFTVITGLLVVGTAAQYVMAHRSGAAGGAARSSLVLGAVAGVVGFFVVPLVGFFVGAVLGVLLAEQVRLGSWDRAWRSTRAVIRGFGIGLLVELGCGTAMILTWVLWVLADR
jgi:uncharacterized protein YqgC (DUF456 family)